MRTALAVLALVALVALVYAAMWRGWRRRAARQADLPPPRPVTDPSAPAVREAEGRYYGTSIAGSWLDRVVVHGLGVRSPCTLRLTAAGLDVLRGDLSFHVPRADLVAVHRDLGAGGRVVPRDGLLVVTWQHPGALEPGVRQDTLESGFRLERAREHDVWVAAFTALTAAKAPR